MSGGGRAKGERRETKGERRWVMSKGGFKFKELRVWQKGKNLAVYIYRIRVIAQNLVDFEQLNAKCRMQIEKCKI